jgi:hypothetical protein
MRYVITGVVGLALVGGIGAGVYSRYFHSEPPPTAPAFADVGGKLSTGDEFDRSARENPVRMLFEALTRYQREVRGGAHFTIEKQERVEGKPRHPEVPPVEVIDAWVRGDVPDPATNKTAIEVVMKWKVGARKPLGIGAEIRGTLFSERPAAEGGLDGMAVTWRPDAGRFTGGPLSSPVPPNVLIARQQSRYCMRDAGLYRSMLRTYEAWKARQDAGEFEFEYLGKKPIEKLGGAECHVVKRVCRRLEMDAFEFGGTAPVDPKVVAAEGFTEVTLYVDAARWLQLGSELYRTEPDGSRVLVGAYYFRDVELNPTVPPDTFTIAGLKK